jgi:phosphoglycerol transferase MdoB-like AlkP superfamily enzyme
MIYGKDIKPDNIDKFCGQIDLAPTLLSLLNISYTQNNFGINLFEEERPCMFFTADNLVGARDSSYIYIYIPDSQQELRYKITDIGLTVAEDNIKFQTLKEYCFSMLQCAEYMVSNHLTVDSKGK